MANPTIVSLPAGAWAKVATNVTGGVLYIKNSLSRSYLHTYRMTGDSAPTDLVDAVPFDKSGFENIESSLSIDVYIFCSSRLRLAGSVRAAV